MSVIANVCGAHAATEISVQLSSAQLESPQLESPQLDSTGSALDAANKQEATTNNYWPGFVCDCVCDLVIASFLFVLQFALDLGLAWLGFTLPEFTLHIT